MKKAIIRNEFYTKFNNDDDRVHFYEGLEVEVLKVIEDESFDSGKAYVVINNENNESVTLDECWLNLIK